VETVWVFVGLGAPLPSAVFRRKSDAEAWIRHHGLTGTLSEFPFDVGTFDHAVEAGLFVPKKPREQEASFIENFSPRLPHEHWRDGHSE
jgi:hypothetical protein